MNGFSSTASRPAAKAGRSAGATLCTSVSVAAGLAVGLALTWYYADHPLMIIGQGEVLEYAGTVVPAGVRTRFSPGAALTATGLVYVMALLTALYPAWKVAKMPPAQALTRGRA